MLFIIALSAVLSTEPPPAANPSLRTELIAMRDADQEVRRRAIKDPKNTTITAEMKQLDAKNIARLREMLKQYGWPGKALAGTDGANAAWTIAQHGGELFLRQTVPLMRAAAERGDLDWTLVAQSIDRDLLAQGKQQTYGTQFENCEPKNLADRAHVDERRRTIGLGPLADYAAVVCTK
jgi:hypothetical protein